MPALISAGFAAGLLFVFLSLTAPPRVPTAADPPGRGPRAERDPGSLAAAAAAGLLVTAVAWLWLAWPVAALAAGAVGAGLPGWYRGARERRRAALVEEAVTEAAEVLRDAARAGVGLEEGMRLLARGGPQPLRATFRTIVRDLAPGGFEPALRAAADELRDPGFDALVAALLLSYRVGGRQLTVVLDGLARSARAAARTRREVRAAQAQNVLSARVVAALPLVLFVAIRATNPGYLAPFATAAGQGVLALCIASGALGYAAMLRVTRLPLGRRWLR